VYLGISSFLYEARLLLLRQISCSFFVPFVIRSRFQIGYNIENAPRQYYLARLLLWWIMLEMVWMLCGLQGLIIQSAQSHHAPDAILLLVPASVLVLFVTIILYIYCRSRSLKILLSMPKG
jgi:hypothetical protein